MATSRSDGGAGQIHGDQDLRLTQGAKDPGQYSPTDEQRQLTSSIEDKYEKWSRSRRPTESTWYLNAAFFRGNQYVYWHATDNRLVTPPAPKHRTRLPINKIFSKVRARHAKFLKNRPIPIVRPATSDLDDRMDARATTKALEYIWRKIKLEQKYRDALAWAAIGGHGYWWFHWDPTIVGRVQATSDGEGAEGPPTQSLLDMPIGDVAVEVGSPFEVLVGNPMVTNLGDQPEIMRIKVRHIDEVRARFAKKDDAGGLGTGGYVQPEAHEDPALRYERQIATLNPQTVGAFNTPTDTKTTPDGKPQYVVVKEWFEHPSPTFPMGRYAVVANGVLLKYVEELPYGYHDMANPYPVVDFPDILQAGQYWNTTVIEQLIPVQREYNLLRSKVAEQVRVMAHPKLLVAKQHQVPKGSWSSEAGEVVEYVAIPGIDKPEPWNPPNIAADVWKSLEYLNAEFDDISHIYPEAEGRVGQATSGFQTNLLQEATDAVHAPDIRMHELAIEEAAYKIRRLMKLGYSVPRFLSVTGRDLQPEAFEFSAEDIDEHADIVVEAGSALPSLKGARVQAVTELFNLGMLGDPADPEVRRRALSMLELGTVEDAYDYARRDEEQARIENDKASENQLAHQPDAWENHQLHYRIHTDLLKSAQSESWDPNQRLALVAHVIQHVKFQNPQSAIDLALRYGLQNVVADLLPPPGAVMQPGIPGMPQGPGPGGAPPPGQMRSDGGPTPPPPGPPSPQTPPAAAANSGANQAVPGGFGARGAEAMTLG